MRYAPWLIIVVLAAMLGCSTEPRPEPGMSALRIKVVAKPKAGIAADHVTVYDQAATSGYGTFEHVDYADLQNIVVWVEPAGTRLANHPPSGAPVAIALNPAGGKTGLTGVACVGQTLVFKNSGFGAINAYSVSDGNEFNLGTIPAMGEARYAVKSAGLIEVLTDSSDTPIATFYAAPTCPVFLTRSNATIDVNGLAPGSYLIVSWHPRLPGTVTDVELSPGRVTHATVEVGVNSLPKIGGK